MISGATEQELKIANARAELLLEIKDKDKEIERLNNIINELEKYLNEQIQKSWEIEEQCYEDIENKLQELKGDSSNE